MSAVAHESFDGALVVKALQAEEAEGRRFADKAELLRDARIEAARVTANFEASLDVLPAVTTVALLVIGVWRIEQGAITAGTLVGLINLFALLIWPLRLIGYVLEDMPRAVAGYERVAEVLAEPLPAEEPRPAEGLPGGPLELVVDRSATATRPAPRCCTRCRSGSRPAPPWPWSGHRVGQVDPGPAAGPPARPRPGGIRPRRPRPGRAGRREVAANVAIAFQEPFLFSLGGRQHRLDRPNGGTAWVSGAAGPGGRVRDRLPAATTRWSASGGDPVGGQRQRVALARALAGRPGCWSWTTPPPASTR